MTSLQLKSAFLLALACCLYVPSAAQVTGTGRCPTMSVVTNFEASRYLGTWYEVAKYFAIFEAGGRCVKAEYSDRGDGVVGVVNTQINIFGGVSQIEGNATLVGANGEAKLSVVFPSLPGNIAAPYWVVDTDYDNYAIVWSCNDLLLLHTINSWILTRERNPQESTMEKVNAALEKNNIRKNLFIQTNQSNCDN